MKQLLPFLLLAASAFAQLPKDSELFQTMQRHDSIFFERGFNRCDLPFLEESLHPDLTFFHDRSGIQGKKKFLEQTGKFICPGTPQKPIRKVLPETLEVNPLYENGKLYGVIQSGIHEFYTREAGKTDVLNGKARFTHVYLLANGRWLLRGY